MLCRIVGRELEFRSSELNERRLSYREKLEGAKEQERALQAFVDKEMPYGYRYFDWDEENKYHKGLYMPQSTSDSTDPEHFATKTSGIPVEVRGLHPRESCGTEGRPHVLQASDNSIDPDMLSEAPTLIEPRVNVPWQPTDLHIVWLLNMLYSLTFLVNQFGLLWFLSGSLLSFFLLLSLVWERIRPLPHDTCTFVQRRSNFWERLVMRLAIEIWAFCGMTAGEIR